MADAFNLLDEPWIPVLHQDGSHTCLGIRAALLEAARIHSLATPSPLDTVSIHRLLIVILVRACPLQTQDQWRDLRDARSLPVKPLRDYLDAQHDRFNLFDPDHPFFQVADTREGPLAAGELDLARSVATAIRHFSHDTDGRTILSPADCARGLAGLPAFCQAGGAGKSPSLNRAHTSYLMPVGATLFETLLLNLPVAECQPDLPGLGVPGDRPAWEGEGPSSGPIGLLQGMTWQPRVVNLAAAASDTAAIRRIVFAKGAGVPEDRPWRDPYQSPSTPARPTGAGFRYGAYWREQWAAVLDAVDRKPGACPILRQLADLDLSTPALNVHAVTLPTDKATCFEVSERMLPISPALRADAYLRQSARDLLEATTTLVKLATGAFSRPGERGIQRDYRLDLERVACAAFTDCMRAATPDTASAAATAYIHTVRDAAIHGIQAWTGGIRPVLQRDPKRDREQKINAWARQALSSLDKQQEVNTHAQ